MPTQKIDYLIEDEIIPGQLYCVISILSPGFNKNLEKYDIRGIKIRGVYSTYEEAQERCTYLQAVDPIHNVFIGEVGKWLPFVDDPEKAKDSQYAEAKLQKLMKTYMENQVKAKQLYEARKNEMMMQAMTDEINGKNKKKKNKSKKTKKQSNPSSQSSQIDPNEELDLSGLRSENLEEKTINVTTENIKDLQSSENNDSDIEKDDRIVDLENEIARIKLQLQLEEKNDKNSTIDNLREITSEMHDIASKKMHQEM
jgi:hypothetical protein